MAEKLKKILDQVTLILPQWEEWHYQHEMAGLACFLASDASSYCTKVRILLLMEAI